MPTVLYPNGRIPQHALDPVPAVGGQTAWLLPLVAAALLRVAAECERLYGFELLVTSAGDGFRSLERQERVFLERYEREDRPWIGGPFDDVRWWRGDRYVRVRGAAAAVPGTSNHGKGITVDLTGLGGYRGFWFRRLAPLLTVEGWSNAEGRRIGEYWHWNQVRTAYHVIDTNRTVPDVSTPAPAGNLPDPIDPLDPIDTLTKGTPMEIRVRRSDGLICHVDTGAGKFIALDPVTNEWLAKLGVNLPAEFDGINPQQMALVRQAVLDINPDPVRVDDL